MFTIPYPPHIMDKVTPSPLFFPLVSVAAKVCCSSSAIEEDRDSLNRPRRPDPTLYSVAR
jgi:hypothetical protein